jgi:hypothetical protein
MTCRNCGKKFDRPENGGCPYCGEPPAQVRSGVMKSSTILISAAGADAVYRSVKEVPVPLRRQLLRSTNGINSATILIADRRGREEITRAIQNLPASLQRRFFRPFPAEPQSTPRWIEQPSVKAAIAWMLGAGSVLMIWFVFTHKWV